MTRFETDLPTYTCPWCWEAVTAVIDCSGLPMEIIEDCEVCCRPARLLIAETAAGELTVDVTRSD